MGLRDEKYEFGLISVFLHWSVAAVLVFALAVALYADLLPRDEGRALRFLHMSLGLLLLPLVITRIMWRLLQGKPITRYQNRIEKALANVVWRVLLFAPIGLFITGPFLAWLHDRPVGFFDFFSIPSPVAPNHELRQQIVFPVHLFFGYLMLFTIGLHILGALKHLIIYKDDVFKRIVRPYTSKRSNVETER